MPLSPSHRLSRLQGLWLHCIALLLCAASLTSCSAQDPAENTAPVQDPFELRGTYAWTFDIPNYGTQVSKNVFGAELVEYSMDGPAYTTRYDIHLESFDAAEGRWVGHTGNGVYYVMFFKDVTDESVTIYKHKCVDQDEAYAFAFPGPDATADHGWNVYVRQEPF